MMEQTTMEDPYEIRLFQMFKSCDSENRGFLDEQELRQLCSLLELQDKGKVVIEDLLHSKTKINFELFKEALLNFLGGGLNDNSTIIEGSNLCQRSLVISDDSAKPLESPPESSDREVSPKLIVGTKKYGRRSRPQLNFNDNDSLSDSDENLTITGDSKFSSKMVERSSSQTDIPGNRRRRTLEKSGNALKRCASLPAQRNLQSTVLASKSKFLTKHKSNKMNVQNALTTDDMPQKTLSSSVESLGHETLSTQIREVWNNYSTEVGSSYLTCAQLRIVCERLGLQTTLAERVAIESFDQLHSCQYNQLISVNDFIKLLTGIITDEDHHQHHHHHVINVMHEICDTEKQATKESSAHMETLSKEHIIEIWERSGINNGNNILLALGFDDNEVRLSHLYKVIEDEVRGLDDEQQTTLLRASLTLQSAELNSVRQVLRQVHDENAKLRADNKEANRRVTMLAMEIDERHAVLEDNAKKEVNALEQRHANAVRDLTARMANDRENWNNLITKLEGRIRIFEQDEIRLKTEVELLHKENDELEGEQTKLQKQITEILEENIKLNREIADLTESVQCNDPKILERHYKVDQNASSAAPISNEDEVLQLVEKLASLQLENHKLRDKNDELVAEVENLCLELQRYKAESKKRSTQSDNENSLEEVDGGSGVSLATKRRGDSPSKTHITEESPRTGKLRKCGNDVEGGTQGEEWMALNAELQQQTNDNCVVPDVVSALRNRVNELELLLKERNSCGDTQDVAELSNKCDHEKIIDRCKELETSLEQMQAAYEDCEDYWQSKLEEERQLYEKQKQIFEEDQQESDKKFTELMEKVREYEEQFNKDGRLSPIEEKDFLEQQYVELEAELKAERLKSQNAVENKNKEIDSLHKEIKALHSQIENLHARFGEIVTDACDFSSKAAAAIISQRDSKGSSASSPISYLWQQSTIQEPAKLIENSTNDVQSAQNKQTNRINLSTTEISMFSTAVTSTDSPTRQTCISPIQKPISKYSQSETDGAAADCDTTSTSSAKSVGTQSLVSTQSERNKSKDVDGGDEKQCRTPTSVIDDIKRLKFVESSLKEEIKDLSFQRDGLVMELQQLQEARPVLEKAYARTAHPNLTQRISQLELKNRHLQNVIKQQQQYSESIMQQSWRQYQTEMNDLHSRLDAQVAMITEQGQRLQNADMLVKDLYVENAHLSATVQRLEQQRFRVTMMHQQQQHNMNQLQGLNIIPGMP